MAKKVVSAFNAVTDCAARLDFWCGVLFSSAPIIGVGLKLADYINLSNILCALSFVPFCVWLYLRSRAKNIKQPDAPILPAAEIKGLPLTTLSEKTSPEHLSLQEAATVLAEHSGFTEERLQWVAPFSGSKSLNDIFWEGHNPGKAHKEILDEAVTIPLINLCLHVCKQNNAPIYGTMPSYTAPSKIPYDKIEYFDAEYKKLYSDIERESTSLIYNDVQVAKDDLVKSIESTDFDALIKEMNQ